MLIRGPVPTPSDILEFADALALIARLVIFLCQLGGTEYQFCAVCLQS